MNDLSKEELLEQIKQLISTNKEKLEFNPNYIDYFQEDELIEIRDVLLNKKEQNKTPSKDYLDEIFNSCS